MTRDLNIGVPIPANFAREVEVQNLEAVVKATQEATAKIEEAVLELTKIKTGTGLAIGVDLDEEAV